MADSRWEGEEGWWMKEKEKEKKWKGREKKGEGVRQGGKEKEQKENVPPEISLALASSLSYDHNNIWHYDCDKCLLQSMEHCSFQVMEQFSIFDYSRRLSCRCTDVQLPLSVNKRRRVASPRGLLD